MRDNSLPSRLEDTFHRSLEEEGGDPCYTVDTADYDLTLHIVSIFVLLFASAVGVAIPLFPKYSSRLKTNPYLIVLGKCAGAGVMLACSLVHMLLPSTEALTSECLPPVFSSYPAFSYAFALFAALSTHLAEHFIEAFVLARGTEPTKNEQGDNPDGGAAGQVRGSVKCDESGDGSGSLRKAKYAENVEVHTQDMDDDSTNDHPSDTEIRKAKQFSETLVVEFSLTVHSILVGLALGVTLDDSFQPLFIALVFHQMLEGVALGCRLAESVLGFWNEMMFSFIFSVSCPIGIIIGISAYSSINQSGQTISLVAGIFDGIGAGLLLYNGFLLLLKDFHEDLAKHCSGDHRKLKTFGMFAVLWVAAFSMSIIGGWA